MIYFTGIIGMVRVEFREPWIRRVGIGNFHFLLTTLLGTRSVYYSDCRPSRASADFQRHLAAFIRRSKDSDIVIDHVCNLIAINAIIGVVDRLCHSTY